MRIKRVLITLGLMLGSFALGLGFWLAVLAMDPAEDAQYEAARTVLARTGLTDWCDAARPALAVDTHGGFHGDGSTLVFFETDQPLMAAIAQAPGWNIAPVTTEEYLSLANAWFNSVPLVSPPQGTIFDAWFYSNDSPDADMIPQEFYGSCLPQSMRTDAVVHSLNWSMAFYDADTGLMTYFRTDF